jgi:hypothetical protein
MLHGVRDINVIACQPHFLQRIIEQPARGTHEGTPLLILFIPRNFAEQYQRRPPRAFAKHDLRRILIQVTAAAMFRCLA